MENLELTDKGRVFLDEWLSHTPFVEAHTSGSTGKPKTIRLPKNDMRVSARATNRFFGINAESLLVCPLSADYIAGKMMIVRAVEAGCRLIMVEPTNHLESILPRIIADYGTVSLLPLVPSQCESFINLKIDGSVRNVIVGGAPVSPETESRLADLDCAIWATYGMTETCSHVAVRPMGSQIYQGMPGVTFSADSQGKLEISAPAYSFGRLLTNDIVEIVDSRHFRWLGRADNVVNSGGIKIFPEELERQLAGLIPFQFYFKGEPDEKWGSRLVLVARCGESEKDQIAEICRANLPHYSIPKEIRCVQEIPKTSNGKLRRL